MREAIKSQPSPFGRDKTGQDRTGQYNTAYMSSSMASTTVAVLQLQYYGYSTTVTVLQLQYYSYSTGFTKKAVARDPPDEITICLVQKNQHDVLETMSHLPAHF